MVGFFILVKMKKICGIYKITSPSGKVYIGESVNVNSRIKSYSFFTGCKNQPKLLNSLKKYGWESHTFEIVEECGFEDLLCRERYWQDFYDVLGENGLNCKLTQCGDLKTTHSMETRSKISKSNIGREGLKREKNPMWGKFGKDNPLHGITRPKEVGEKISKTKKGVPNKAFKDGVTEDFRNKMSKIKLGNKSRPKLVLDTQTGIFYNSAKEAANLLCINYSTLVDYLKGKYQNKTNLIYV
jgi:group I intron endonuclease